MKVKQKDTILRNPIALAEQGRDTLRVYYDTIGREYNADERHVKYSQPRQAFGVALTKLVGDTITADVLSKDRTTIVHYRNRHDSNLRCWDGYSIMYETAEYIVNSYFEGRAKLDRMEYINKMISQLLKEKVQIQSQLHEQLQVQDHEHSWQAVR